MSLCNSVSIIQAPEIQSNSNNGNSPHAWLQFSPITLLVTFKFEPSQPVFLIYRECLLQYSSEELPYIMETIFGFMEDGGRINGISFPM